MSRVSLIEKLYVKKKSALEFDYDMLMAPPIYSIFTQQDINELIRIATSLRYNGDINRKYELIDAVMMARGFKKAHSGTNRVVYNFLEDPTFVAKVAVDKVGMTDSPAAYKNQEFFKPFCCKIFEVDSSGVIAFVERVNPITSLEEFKSVADDVFNMMITKIIGKYVVDDLGTQKFMNYGLRYNSNGCSFGPVIIDFPYAYELDGAKLICNKPDPMTGMHCGGEIDYDDGLNYLVCTRCGRKYKAMDLKKNDKNILLMYNDQLKGVTTKMRSRIVSGDKVIKDSGFVSNANITKEEYENLPGFPEKEVRPFYEVSKTIFVKKPKANDIRQRQREDALTAQYRQMKQRGLFNAAQDNITYATVATKRQNAERTKQAYTPKEYMPKYTPGTIEVSETIPYNQRNAPRKPTPEPKPEPVEEVKSLEFEEVSDEVCHDPAVGNFETDFDGDTDVGGTPPEEETNEDEEPVVNEEEQAEPEQHEEEEPHQEEEPSVYNLDAEEPVEYDHNTDPDERDMSMLGVNLEAPAQPIEFEEPKVDYGEDYDDDDDWGDRSKNRDRDRRNQRRNKNNRRYSYSDMGEF